MCRSSSGNHEERERLGLPRLSFHSFPKKNSVVAKEWIAKIRRDPGSNFVITKHTKICSNHFTTSDYVPTVLDYPASRSRLKPTAIPSIFPWTTEVCQRKSITSQKTSSLLQCGEYNDHDVCDNCVAEPPMDESDDRLEDNNEYEVDDCRNYEEKDASCSPKSKIQALKQQIQLLQDSLNEAKKSATKLLFRLENIKEKDDLVKFYTGFPNYDTLVIFYEEILESDAKVMKQWDGKRYSEKNYDDVKYGRPSKLPLLEQLFLTLVRLRLGLFEQDLAIRFGLSQSTVSRITTTWINLMYHSLKGIERFPPWHIVKKYMPEVFKKEYPNTRIIIDATEFAIERPSSLVSQSCTFSTYKNRNTVKVLVGVTPSGAISFVSECYEGSISDKKLVEVSGLLEKLEPGDEVMADKGFQIQDILAPFGVRLNIPPFLNSNYQMPADDVILTKKVAHLRIHVERAIGRIKEFHILQNVLPATMWDTINQVIYVCCMLTNFSPPLVG